VAGPSGKVCTPSEDSLSRAMIDAHSGGAGRSWLPWDGIAKQAWHGPRRLWPGFFRGGLPA